MWIRVSNYIARKLIEGDIVHGFSVMGGDTVHLNNALDHEDGLAITYDCHKQACTTAAECHAHINNKPAAVCVTTGPDDMNTLTDMIDAWLDLIPMLVFSGQVRTGWTTCMSGMHTRTLGD